MSAPHSKKPRRQPLQMGAMYAKLRRWFIPKQEEGTEMPRDVKKLRFEVLDQQDWVNGKVEEDIENETRNGTAPLSFVVRAPIHRVPIQELPDEAFGVVMWAWNNYLDPNETMGQPKRGIRLKRSDVQTLQDSNWLNDEVINYYLEMIVERSGEPGHQSVYASNTQFYTKLVNSGYPAVKRWTKGVDIFAKRFLLIPVHLGNHWCLTVVDFEHKRIDYYDSLLCCNWEGLMAITSYLCEESLEKRSIELDMEGWTVACRKDIPRQMNGYDCGVFLCVFADYLSRRAAFNFQSSDDMQRFRRRITYEICSGRFLP